MTRKLELVNTSNAEGENFEIVEVNSRSGQVTKRVIPPGESLYVFECYESGTILFRPVQDGEPKAFTGENGKQVVPKMHVTFDEVG